MKKLVSYGSTSSEAAILLRKDYKVDRDARRKGWVWNVLINGKPVARCESEQMAQRIEESLRLVDHLLVDAPIPGETRVSMEKFLSLRSRVLQNR